MSLSIKVLAHSFFVSNLEFILNDRQPRYVTKSIVSLLIVIIHFSVNAQKIANVSSFLLSTEPKL